MKKVYAMLTLFAVMSLSASAQVEQQVVDEAADAALLNERSYAPGSVIRKVEEAPKAPIGYKNPEGTYWISLSEKNYGYSGYTFLFSSPCVPLEFTAIHGDTVSREWKYVDPSEEYGMFNPKLTSTEKTINLTYTYAKPTQIEIPALKGTGTNLTDSTFMGNSYMLIARPYLENTSAGRYGMGNNPTAKVFWFNTKYYNSSTFTFNSNYQDIPFQQRWLNQYKSWYGDGVTAVKVKALGEHFAKPVAPLTLNAVLLNARATAELKHDIKMTVRDANLNILGYFVKKVDDIAPHASYASYDYYMMKFTELYDAEGNQIEELILDKEFYVFCELDPEDTETQLSIYYYRAPYMSGNISMKTLCDMTRDGVEYTDIALNAGGVFTDNTCNKSFTIWLLGQFNYLKGDVTEYEAPTTGGNVNVKMTASKEYLTYMERDPNWNVTLQDGSNLPNWITVDATDSFDEEYIYQGTSDVKITVAPQGTESEAREAVVMFSYQGDKHLVKITQAATTTGITTITTENDDNAPAYNIAGQRVNSNTNGIIIKNGKKVINR